jgi:Fe-S-cluster containining protein
MIHIMTSLQKLTQEQVEAAVERLPTAETVSCCAGCGACCKQMVPISLSEAVFLTTEVLPQLTPEHRQRVEERIREAERKLAEVGMITRMEELAHDTDPEERQKIGICYMLMRIPCPFLEEESCSIHSVRPLACREYLVTSDPGHCVNPMEGGVKQVPMPHKGSNALIRMDAVTTGTPGWMPMILALIHSLNQGKACVFTLPEVQHPEVYLDVFRHLLAEHSESRDSVIRDTDERS